ncbi:acetyl-CoA synthetase-like protein, partial [Aspergillus fijiensis CBS 313.89]
YTNASDVLFGLIDDSHGTGKGSEALVPCRLLLEPEDTLAAATAKIAQFQDLVPSLEQIGLTELRTMSPDAAKIGTFNNLLVIRRGAVGSRVTSFLDPNGHPYALTIICTVESDRMSNHAQFDRHVLEEFVVDSMLDQLASAFDCARDGSASQVRELRAINLSDMQKIRDWNDRISLPEKGTTCIHHLVERRCRQRPSAPAVCAWDGELTYEELNQRASRLARQLVVHHAVRPDRLVFILTDRSMWTTIAVLGALKAGAGIAFLDPSQPTHRLVTICSKADAHLILSVDKHASKARHLGPPVVTFAEIDSYLVTDNEEEEFHPPTMQGHHVAYATFTSGSTGEPKGVLIEHAAFTCNYTRYCELSDLTSDSRVLHGASYGFVVSILENLLTLSVGGCVCIPSDSELQESVAAAMQRYRVTWTMMTPSVARTIDPAATPSVKSVLLAGEPMGRGDLRQWAGHAAVYNLYAQSEFCTAITLARKSDAEGEDGPSTLGPAVGCHAWVVDPQDHDQLMPIGAEGELVVSGPSMFRGYVNNPDQTSAALIGDPSWMRPQEIGTGLQLLKTGDLVRYNSSTGSLEFRGRKGNRVKIRGQRIELGEVEFHLRTHFPGSGNLVVDLVHPVDESAEQHLILVAFVLTSAKEKIQRNATAVFGAPTPEFRLQVQRTLTELRKVLPGYMVPSAFVAVTTFPRTVSGKLSRAALCEAASGLSRKQLASYTTAPKSYRSPATEPERVLQAVCAELLGLHLSSVGMDDNFIDLGGDSLSARRLVAMVRAEGWGLSLVDCLSEPTLSHLALRVQQPSSDDMDPSPPTAAQDPFESIKEEFLRNLPEGLNPDLVEDVLPAREIQGLYSQEEIQDYLLWQLTGPFDTSQLRQACEALIRKHPILRTIFLPYQDQCMQIVLRDINLPFEVVHSTSGSQSLDMIARSLAMQDRQIRYQTTQPIVKFTLIQAQDSHKAEPPILIMRLSHAQYDGLSLRPLLHHLANLYTATAQPLRTDYADYTRRCRQLRTPQALTFWRTLLEGSILTSLHLPQPSPDPSRPHPAEDKTLHLTRTVPLPSPLPQGITTATLIKAAWAAALHQETHSQDIVFAQLVNARDIDLPDLDTLIGPCLNIIPVRVGFPPSPATPDTSKKGAHALLTTVQAQHAHSLEYSTCQWQEIVTQCTDWARNGGTSTVSSIVLHENFDAKPEVDLGGGRRWKMLSPILSNPPDQTIFLTTWPERDVLSVMFSVSSRWVRREDAERLVERFCGNLAGF